MVLRSQSEIGSVVLCWSKDVVTEVPPGSPEAIKHGCTCPVIDNHHGRGCRGDGKQYITNPGCRLHHSRDRLGEALQLLEAAKDALPSDDLVYLRIREFLDQE